MNDLWGMCHVQIPTLVHGMILVEVWKQKVFPIICKLQDFSPMSSFPLHIVVCAHFQTYEMKNFTLKLIKMLYIFFNVLRFAMKLQS